MKRCGHRSEEEGAVCKPQSEKLHADDLPEASRASSVAILKNEMVILCVKTTILESKHSTAVMPSVQGYIRRFTQGWPQGGGGSPPPPNVAD